MTESIYERPTLAELGSFAQLTRDYKRGWRRDHRRGRRRHRHY